jgi:hypothetical protein
MGMSSYKIEHFRTDRLSSVSKVQFRFATAVTLGQYKIILTGPLQENE